jgi:hypothetical protein
MKRLFLLTLLYAAVLPSASVSAASIRECGNFDGSHWTNSQIQGAGIYNVTSRVVGCGTARKVARRAYNTYRSGRVWRYNGWTCRIVSQATEFSDTRCTRGGGRVVRWQSGS